MQTRAWLDAVATRSLCALTGYIVAVARFMRDALRKSGTIAVGDFVVTVGVTPID